MPFHQGIYANDSGTWRQSRSVHVNDSGTWRWAKRVYVNDSGTWRLVHAMANINLDTIYTSPTLDFTSRDSAGAQGVGYWKWNTTVDAWQTRSWVHQDSGGFTGDSGWVTGASHANANQAHTYVCLPTKTSDQWTPPVSCVGNHYGTYWYAYWDNETVYPTVDGTNPTSQPSGWTSC